MPFSRTNHLHHFVFLTRRLESIIIVYDFTSDFLQNCAYLDAEIFKLVF